MVGVPAPWPYRDNLPALVETPAGTGAATARLVRSISRAAAFEFGQPFGPITAQPGARPDVTRHAPGPPRIRPPATCMTRLAANRRSTTSRGPLGTPQQAFRGRNVDSSGNLRGRIVTRIVTRIVIKVPQAWGSLSSRRGSLLPEASHP